MEASYNKKNNILYLCSKGRIHAEELETAPGIVVDLVGEDPQFPCAFSGIEVSGASAFLPLGKKGYDAATDTLTFGESTDVSKLITENGDFVGYWVEDPHDPDDAIPIGVALRRASKYLSPLSAACFDGPPECQFVSVFYDSAPAEAFYSEKLSMYVSRHFFYNFIYDHDEWGFPHVGH